MLRREREREREKREREREKGYMCMCLLSMFTIHIAGELETGYPIHGLLFEAYQSDHCDTPSKSIMIVHI